MDKLMRKTAVVVLTALMISAIAYGCAEAQSNEALDALNKALNTPATPSQPSPQPATQPSPAKKPPATQAKRAQQREQPSPPVALPPVYEDRETVLFENGNIGRVTDGAMSPTTFALMSPVKLTSLTNYHYFNSGHLPGTIGLKGQDGTVYGPWNAIGLPGQGNVPNAYWQVTIDVDLPAGAYEVLDSDPQTWSSNGQSQGKGFTTVRGRRGL